MHQNEHNNGDAAISVCLLCISTETICTAASIVECGRNIKKRSFSILQSSPQPNHASVHVGIHSLNETIHFLFILFLCRSPEKIYRVSRLG